jgi:hypothetical protein
MLMKSLYQADGWFRDEVSLGIVGVVYASIAWQCWAPGAHSVLRRRPVTCQSTAEAAVGIGSRACGYVRSMTRFPWRIALLALVATLVPAEASARHQDLPSRIDLPNAWQPEGITTNGTHLFVGSLANGAIWRAMIGSGNGRVLAEGVTGRVAVGVDYDYRRNLIWVAGGDTNKIRAHSARTGKVRAKYKFPSASGRFLNDLVVTRRGVFATDSMNQELAVVPFRKDGSLRGPRAARTLPLTGDLVYEEGFNLNGIVKSHGRLLAVQSNTGELFRIGPRSGTTRLVDIGTGTLASGDGLEIRRDKLFVVRNFANLIAVVDLNRRLTKGEVVRELTSDGFDIPTTVAKAQGFLWAVNARFNTEPMPDTEYWVTRVDPRP